MIPILRITSGGHLLLAKCGLRNYCTGELADEWPGTLILSHPKRPGTYQFYKAKISRVTLIPLRQAGSLHPDDTLTHKRQEQPATCRNSHAHRATGARTPRDEVRLVSGGSSVRSSLGSFRTFCPTNTRSRDTSGRFLPRRTLSCVASSRLAIWIGVPGGCQTSCAASHQGPLLPLATSQRDSALNAPKR